MKKLMLIVISISISIFLFSCNAVNNTVSNKKATITINVNDIRGGSGNCFFRIIKPVADTSSTFEITDVYTYNGVWNSSHTFENVEAGNYGVMIGSIGQTYRNISVSNGQNLTVNMYTYIAGYITTYYGTTIPVYQWTVDIK